MTDNQDLMILRGKYLTLTTEYEKLRIEFSSHQNYFKQKSVSVEHGNIGHESVTNTLNEIKVIVDTLISRHEKLTEIKSEIERIKPMTGLS